MRSQVFFHSSVNIYNISYILLLPILIMIHNTTGTIPWGAKDNDYPIANVKRPATLNQHTSSQVFSCTLKNPEADELL